MVNRIGDIAGVRVVCFYIAEVYEIVEEIKKLNNLTNKSTLFVGQKIKVAVNS